MRAMPTELQHIAAFALAAAHMLIAAVVTAHVLLHKRDVGSAIGWIGLAWLSPFMGSALYAMFGINRVRRRATRLDKRRRRRGGGRAQTPIPRDDHLAPLEHAVRTLTGRRAEPDNRLTMLQCGDEAYPRMLAAIAGAKRSIALSSYILRADSAGDPFIEALSEAHGRGVQVRVLIDGIGSGYLYSGAYRRLRHGGVPAARFMHSLLPWRMPFVNLRSHKKILVVDGVHGFTGGLNIGAENVLATNPPFPVRDTHFAVEGPVVAQLMTAFAEDWQFTTGEHLEGDAWFPDIEPDAAAGEAVARVVTSGPDQDVEKIEYIVLQAIASARHQIRVMTPYFLPDERMITALELAAMRGVRVDIVLPAVGNHKLVDWATRAQIPPLLEARCHVWYNPPPFDHSKLLVIDGEWCLVGSSNWDMRSFRLNFELNVEVYHSGLARKLDALAKRHQGEAITLEALKKRSLPIRLRDAGARLMLPYL